MPDFSKVTCKTEVTIACGDDVVFFEKTKEGLLLSSTTESPISVRKWLESKEESMFFYTGIIVILKDMAEKKGIDYLVVAMQTVMPQITGTTDSPLSTQKVLLCKGGNDVLIETFCTLHDLEKERLATSDADVTFWSTFANSSMYAPGFKPSKQRAVYQ